MAIIVDGNRTPTITANQTTATFADWFADQQNGDLFIVACSNNTSSTQLTIASTTGTWTEIAGTSQVTGNTRTAVFWAIRSGGIDISEPTITGSSGRPTGAAVRIRDADLTTFLDVAEADSLFTVNTTTPSCPSVTTANDDTLILRIAMVSSGTIRQAAVVGQGVTAMMARNQFGVSTQNQTLAAIDYSTQPTAGAVGTYDWRRTESGTGRCMTLAIRNASGGKVPCSPRIISSPVVDEVEDAGTVELLIDYHATLLGGIIVRDSSTTGGTLSSTIRGWSLNAEVNGLWHWGRRMGQNMTANTGLPGIYGVVRTIAETDYSNALFCQVTQWENAAGHQPYLYFRDAVGGWTLIAPTDIATHSLSSNIAKPLILFLPSFAEADGSGDIDWTRIVRIGWAINRTAGSPVTQPAGVVAGPLMRLTAAPQIAFVGGTATKPFDFRDVAKAMQFQSFWYVPLIQGAKQQIVALSAQIGDGGTTKTYCSGSATAFEFLGDWAGYGARIPNNYYEMSVKLGATDSFRMGASAVGSSTQQLYVIDPASDDSATYSFRGTLFGMLPEFIPGITINNLTMTTCGKIAGEGVVFSSCSISESTATDAAMRQADGGEVINSSFEKGSETYAIEVVGNGPLTLDLTNTTFSGYTTDLNILGTAGTVTITLAEGQTEPTYDTAGATVVFDQPLTLAQATVTNFTAGSRIIVYNETQDIEVYNEIVTGGSSWSLEYENGTPFNTGDTVKVYHVYYQLDGEYATRKTVFTTIAASTGWAALINEQECLTYSTYFQTFGTIGEAVWDAGEYIYDGLQVDVDVDPSDATNFYIHRLFQWDKYALWFTGNRLFFDKITSPTPSQINISDLLIENISNPATHAIQRDIIQVTRTDGNYPVRNPSTYGGTFDIIWQTGVLQTSVGGLSPSETQIKQWVREELNPELVKVDKIDKITKLIPAAL
jgi:hypothetical protein